VGHGEVFSLQLAVQARKDDVLIVLSGSESSVTGKIDPN